MEKKLVYIMGYPGRGEEVIAELEKLGGKNDRNHDGRNPELYYIDPGENVITVAGKAKIRNLLLTYGEELHLPERKSEPPRSWEEFCERFPPSTYPSDYFFTEEDSKALLALMQLLQLRKTWVGNHPRNTYIYNIHCDNLNNLHVYDSYLCRVMNFPTKEMADDFLECFHDLLETAKVLL